MRLLIAALGVLTFSTLWAQDIHSPESFMPAFEGWKVVEVKPFAHTNRKWKSPWKKGFWKKKVILGAEQKAFRSKEGLKGFIIFVSGATLVKAVEITKDHTHAALRTAQDIWVYGEAGTASLVQVPGGIAFCLEDYVTKKTACSATITLR